MDEETYLKYSYQGDDFWFVNNKLRTFEFKTSMYYINCKNQDIKPGDNIGILSSIFPNSYSLRKQGRILINLKHNGNNTDSFLIINYNPSNLITEISLQ
jgi:hypothetical protein